MKTTPSPETPETDGTGAGAPTPMPSETVRDLPLSALRLSERNVRRMDDTPEEMANLKASILAHGPIQNLTVRPVGERYDVIAGKRRVRAMRELVYENELHPDTLVPCRILDEATNDIEISLAENEARVDMHVVDQVTAFRRLTEEGITREKIAARFGITERTVDQRLRLAGLPDEILDAGRNGQLNLEHLQAFAVTTDQTRQLEVWNRVKDQDYQPGTHWIRSELTRSSFSANHSRARFVGLETYTAAGGRIEADLFSDGKDERAMLIDPEILNRLAAEKLQEVAEDLLKQGWKWAEPHIELDWDAAQAYGRLRGAQVGPSEEQTAELERIKKRGEEIDTTIEEMAGELEECGNEPPEDHPYWALSDEREALEQEENRILIEIDQNVSYSPEQMACAGCLVTIDQWNGLTMHSGLVRAADAGDVPQPAKTPRAGGSGADPAEPGGEADEMGEPGAPGGYTPPIKRSTSNPETEAVKSAGLTNTLAEDLRLIRTALVKAHLAHDFEAAFDLATYEMTLKAFHKFGHGSRPLAMTLNDTTNRPLGQGAEITAFDATSPGIELLERDRAELPLHWLEEENPGRRFIAFTELPLADRQRLFAAATARALNKQLSFDHGANPETEATIARLDIPFEALWRPGLDRFWKQMRKGEMLAVASRTLGPEWAATHAKDKKDALAEAMAAAFGPDGEAESLGLDAAGRAAALSWTPAGFRAFDPARPAEEKTDESGAGDTPPDGDANANDETADTPASGDDNVNGAVLQHPLGTKPDGEAETGDNGDTAEAERDDEAETFDHQPVDELPPFMRN